AGAPRPVHPARPESRRAGSGAGRTQQPSVKVTPEKCRRLPDKLCHGDTPSSSDRGQLMKRFAWTPVILGAMFAVVAAWHPSAQTPQSGPATFTKDVAPILQRSCQKCHRPGSMAPMSFLTYEDVRPWVRSIRQKVAAREMPPWYIDRTVGIRKFDNDPSLSDEEVTTITKWADNGAPRGNPADMPPPMQFSDDNIWHIGKPDLVVKSVQHT